MFKMKSLPCIVALFSLALVSCIARIPEKEMPDVDNGVITMIQATVEPLELKGATGTGLYSWNEAHAIGIYGSAVGQNECYLPVKSTIGDNEAYFFGNTVGGELTLYMPYSKQGSEAALDGRVTVPAKQQYYADPFDHLMYNSTFFATATTNEARFDFYAGLIKIEIKYDIQDITSVKLLLGNISTDVAYSPYLVGDLAVDEDVENLVVNGATSLVIDGFPEGIDSTIANPLVVWAVVAPGEFENLVVEISSSEGTIASPVRGPFLAERCAISEQTCVAQEVKHDNGIGDFEGENGEFNPKN